jgi:hypothetical protein
MLLDLEHLDILLRNRLSRTHGDRDGDQPQDLLRLPPAVERGPLIGADHEHGVVELLVAEQFDRIGVLVEPHLRVGQVPEGQPGKLEPGRRIEHSRLVTRFLCHEHEQPVGPELPQRSFRQRDVAEMRRVERAAEDRRRQSVTVSSPISTSAPVFAPAARSTSSSSSPSGGVPTTRNPRSVRKIR